jgi:mRNA-degrading endonuclease YafQ of YafQ-DinJ toxin-antitoxin module
MLQAEYTTKFKKDLKLAKRRNKNLFSLQKIIEED